MLLFDREAESKGNKAEKDLLEEAFRLLEECNFGFRLKNNVGQVLEPVKVENIGVVKTLQGDLEVRASIWSYEKKLHEGGSIEAYYEPSGNRPLFSLVCCSAGMHRHAGSSGVTGVWVFSRMGRSTITIYL